MTSPPCIALLTDFGTQDWYVAALKGVMLARCPRAQVVDITHEVPPCDVTSGAVVLAGALPWLPAGSVVVVVVDPGVGTPRSLIAARADGRYLLGPDNGLLALALERAHRVTMARLTQRTYWLSRVSQTFHGRDILAPVAAYLASGGALTRLGPIVHQIHPLPVLPLKRTRESFVGTIIHIDHFGNLITNIPWPHGKKDVAIRYKHRQVRVVSSYGAGRPNELIAVRGSLGFMELAIREASAAHTVHADRGDAVRIPLRSARADS